jgi:hypothetical protein
VQSATLQKLLASPSPLSSQSTVTTTTVITTIITTNSEVHPGDIRTSFQPWVAHSTRTDVQETSTVASRSDMCSIEYPTAMEVDEAPAEVMIKSEEVESQDSRKGVRRHFNEIAGEGRKLRRSTRRARRTSAPTTVGAAQVPTATISAIVSPLSNLATNRQTPTCLLRLSVAPKPSDLIVVRLVSATNDSPGDYLATVEVKHAVTAAGEIVVAPIPLPAHLSNPPPCLEEAKLRFSWFSGDHCIASQTSEQLGPTLVQHEPSTKRPKLQ